MSPAKILNFPVGSRRAEKDFRSDSDQIDSVGGDNDKAFWLLPGEAEKNSEILFWFSGTDPMNESPNIADIETICTDSRVSMRQITILEGSGEDIAVIGHAVFEEKWNASCSNRRISLIDSSFSNSRTEDIRFLIESEETLATAKPNLRLIIDETVGKSETNPILVGLL